MSQREINVRTLSRDIRIAIAEAEGVHEGDIDVACLDETITIVIPEEGEVWIYSGFYLDGQEWEGNFKYRGDKLVQTY